MSPAVWLPGIRVPGAVLCLGRARFYRKIPTVVNSSQLFSRNFSLSSKSFAPAKERFASADAKLPVSFLQDVPNLQQPALAKIQPLPSVAKIPQPTLPKQTVVVADDVENTLTIQQAGESVEVPLLWLRDSCTCNRCVNQGAYQRSSWTIITDARLKEADVTDGILHAVWMDGHESRHELAKVKAEFQPRSVDYPLVRRQLWDRSTWKGLSLPAVPHDEIFTDKGLRELLTRIQRFGFGLVNNCGVSEAATEKLVNRVAPPMPTTFSPGMWTFTSDMARSDTAYSSAYLAPHTDTTYFSNPCRIQVFHCLEREGCTGGDTILVDGFYNATTLRRKNPAAYQTLSTVSQECVYVEPPSVCYKWTDTVFKHSGKDETLQRVRFNMYDRSTKPPLCPTKEVNKFYMAVKEFADLTQSAENQLLLKLTPGVVVFIDNWRVLHGRTQFSGRRVLSGCYMSTDEFDHTCRRFSIIP